MNYFSERFVAYTITFWKLLKTFDFISMETKLFQDLSIARAYHSNC